MTVTVISTDHWLSFYIEPHIWLVKEKEAAIIVVPFYRKPSNRFMGAQGGFITIVRENGSRPEKWWTDEKGNGHDGNPILAPITSKAANNWKFNPLKHKRTIERSIAFIKESIKIQQQDVQRLETYLEKHVAEPAMIQDIIE